MERTLAIIKPDGVTRNLSGRILAHYEEHGLQVIAMKMCLLSPREAEGFYAVHRERPFFSELVTYMTSAPVIICVLAGENAIKKNREIMGATNPAEAEKGTIRALYGRNIGENTVHGSDGLETARFEIDYFFAHTEIFAR